jgi:hypothetical protein
MSSDRRAPWWFSGDDEQEPESVARPDPTPQPTSEPALDSADEADGTSSSMDWTALVAGAARMVDWATERVMAPHAEHTDPAEHPDCMVCRTVTLIGDPVGLMTGGQRPSPDGTDAAGDVDAPLPDAVETTAAQPIRWIPIVESRD